MKRLIAILATIWSVTAAAQSSSAYGVYPGNFGGAFGTIISTDIGSLQGTTLSSWCEMYISTGATTSLQADAFYDQTVKYAGTIAAFNY